jgi:hypothetical protein
LTLASQAAVINGMLVDSQDTTELIEATVKLLKATKDSTMVKGTTTDLNGNMSLPGFHDIDTVGLKFAQLISDGQNHQGEFIELYPIVKEDASYFL